jgi:hypothetical protein
MRHVLRARGDHEYESLSSPRAWPLGCLPLAATRASSQGDAAHSQIATLNHLWAALDDGTAGAVIASNFLKTFANGPANLRRTLFGRGPGQRPSRYLSSASSRSNRGSPRKLS